jgi:hypothetical protein
MLTDEAFEKSVGMPAPEWRRQSASVFLQFDRVRSRLEAPHGDAARDSMWPENRERVRMARSDDRANIGV